jgi:hypothetical protein
VPDAWFATVDQSERRYRVDDEGVPHLSYETTVEAALARVSNAAQITAQASLPQGVTGALRGVGAWLDGFDSASLLELDYGTVAELFAADALADDRSAHDVAAALEALRRGDVMRSSFHYATLTARWSAVRSLEHQS